MSLLNGDTLNPRTATKLDVLKAAAQFVGRMGQAGYQDIKSEHVLVLADKWLKWVDGVK